MTWIFICVCINEVKNILIKKSLHFLNYINNFKFVYKKDPGCTLLINKYVRKPADCSQCKSGNFTIFLMKISYTININIRERF